MDMLQDANYVQRFNETGAYAKPSYRQVGKNTGGKVVKGAGKRLLAQTTPSIPSKFETKLSVRNTENDAFGGRTERFYDKKTTNPGPGSYHKATTLVRENDVNPSCSKKGFLGGFVSQTSRFNNLKADQDAEKPGPGQYSEFDPRRAPLAKTSMFKPPTSKVVDDSERKVPLPGPGQYDATPKDMYKRNMNRKAGAAFASQSARVRFVPNRAWVPAPGQYDTGPAADRLQQQGQPASQAAFKASAKREQPHLQGRNSVPGPGDYEVERAERALGADPGLTDRPASFFSNTGQDRFGHSYRPRAQNQEMPGPGWYEKDRLEEVILPATNAAFKSATARQIGAAPHRDARPPGPAFYSPEPADRGKSFMLNANRKWV